MSQPDQPPQPSSPGGEGSSPQQPGYGYDQQPYGYDQQAPGYDQQPYGYGQQPSPYDPQAYGHGQQGHGYGYGQQPYGYDQQPSPYGQPGYGYAVPAYGYGYGQPALGPDGKPPLDQPHYGIGFADAVKRVFAKYARFDGRASRSEYWWWVLAYSIVVGLLSLPLVLTPGPDTGSPSTLASLLAVVALVVVLAVLVPTIAVTVRRLHDADLSGWLYLLALIPWVGGLVVLVLTLLPPKPGGARFDRPPALVGPTG